MLPTGSAAQLTGLTSGQVTTALGFTPYSALNPSGYTSNTGTVTSASVVSANGFSGTVATASTTPQITLSLDNGAISNVKMSNVPSATFKGRASVGTGVPEDITVAQAKTLLDLTGSNTGDQTITLTGAVTGSGTGAFTTTLSANSVDNTKLSDIPTSTIKGRVSAGTGDVEDLTSTQVKTLLNITSSDVSGTKTSAFISDFTEAAQDSTGAMIDTT